MITFDTVCKAYTPDVPILVKSSFTIQEWSFVSVMGPSWTGKTTILNLIAGLVRPDSGSIMLWSQQIEQLDDDTMTRLRWSMISFIFQQFYLLPQLTVEENIDLWVQLNWLERRFSTNKILQKVWLEGRNRAYPTELSWWEQQRVAVARAFVGATPILLADEPTGNLDINTAREIMNLMQSLQQEVWNTIVMITHDQAIANYATQHYTLIDTTLRDE